MLAAVGLAACGSPEQRAEKADAVYAAAVAQNDNWSAKEAMIRAVAAKDDVPQYWMQLAKAEMALQQYGDAYNAYLRASELDRSNAEALQALADISLMSGRPAEADHYADQVLLLQPGSPPPLLTKGFIALRAGKFDDAIKQADAILAIAPLDTNAVILKARALAAKGDLPQATAILEKQIGASASQSVVLSGLLQIYEHVEDKANVARTRERMLALDPTNRGLALDYARALYDAGQGARGRQITLGLIDSTKSKSELSGILSLWGQSESRAWAIAQANSRAPGSPAGLRIVYAQFLIAAGDPAAGQALIEPLVAQPVTARNADALALLARAQSDQGQSAKALPLLNAILAFDEGNAIALRSRAELYLKTGRPLDAQWDCQRLIATNPRRAADRLCLVRAYRQAGRADLADSTVWRALNDIPEDRALYVQARKYFSDRNQPTSIARVDQLFKDQHALEQSRW